MTKVDKGWGIKSQTGYLVPIITILLSSALLMSVGYAGVVSSVDVFENNVESDGLVIVLKDDDGSFLASGEFSSGIDSIKYSQIGTSYYIFGGERTLGSSKIVIDATQSNATGISLSASVTYKLNTGSTYLEGLPYNMDSKFEYRYGNSTGTVISDSDNITITPGEINTLYVKFIGKLDNNYIGTNQPVSFVYNITFEATSK